MVSSRIYSVLAQIHLSPHYQSISVFTCTSHDERQVNNYTSRQASATSLVSSKRGLKRGCFSPEPASSSADEPAVKKPRPQKQCYPGAHIEVWHEFAEISQPEEALRRAAVEAKVTADNHQPAQQLQSCISITPDRRLSTTQDTPGSVITPVYSGRPSCEATYFEQWSQEPTIFLQSLPTATDLSLSTYNPTPSLTFSNTAYEKWAEICSNTLLSPATWVDSNPKPLPETQALTCPTHLEGGDLYNDLLNQTYEDPTSYLAGLFNPDFCYYPWTASNDLAMGGGEHFPASHQAQAALPGPPFLSRLEEECEPLPPEGHHESWPPQQPGLNLMPNCPSWTDTQIPTQPILPQTLDNYTSPIQPLKKDGPCLDESSCEDQVNHTYPLVLRPQQSPQNPQPKVAGAGEEQILTVSEDCQDAGPQCTCDTESCNTNSPCSSCANSLQSWVMVTYKLKPPGKADKKPPKPRKRLEEDARRQTSQTREIGACVRCKIQRVRCIPNSEDAAGPCEACSRVAVNYSKKVLHHIPCHRYKLQEVIRKHSSSPFTVLCLSCFDLFQYVSLWDSQQVINTY